MDVNVMGVKHLCHFAQQCANLKMFMHVSTGQSNSQLISDLNLRLKYLTDGFSNRELNKAIAGYSGKNYTWTQIQ